MDMRDKGKTGNSRKAYKFDEIVEQSWAEHIQRFNLIIEPLRRLQNWPFAAQLGTGKFSTKSEVSLHDI